MRANGASGHRVSIGLPVFNGERYLADALDSLLAQEYADFELVVGDNGSTDGTSDICRTYAARDARIRYLRSEENRGAAWNFNRVFYGSTGGYFRWAAYDDLVAPQHLGRCVEALDAAGPDVVLAFTETSLIDEDGNRVCDYDEGFDASHPRARVRVARIVRHLVLSNVLFGLVRREVMEKTHLHGAYPSADWALIIEWAMQGSFVQVPERLFFRRFHPAMSRFAHADVTAVAEFFAPGSGGTVRPEFLRLFSEELRAICRAPVGVTTKLTTAATFVPMYATRHKRQMVREVTGMHSRRPRRPVPG